MSNKIKKIFIKTKDDYTIACLVIEPKSQIRGVIQFLAGTAIKKEFYLKLASFLSEYGFVVVIFDYRGVGESRPKSLRNFKASITDWGRYDAPAVLDYINTRYTGLPIHLLAHSMGGQLLGLMEHWTAFDRILMLATSSGNYNNFLPVFSRLIKIMTNISFPIFLPLLGYIPRQVGLGNDWPKGVATEWLGCSRANMRMAEFLSTHESTTYYKAVDKRIIAWFFPTDHMATPKTIPNLKLSYPNAQVITRVIEPKNFDLNQIGHVGIFKEKAKAKLWPELLKQFVSLD